MSNNVQHIKAKRIQSAIEESIVRACTVTIEASWGEIEELRRAADDWSENGNLIEFWGRDDAWRVHTKTAKTGAKGTL